MSTEPGTSTSVMRPPPFSDPQWSLVIPICTAMLMLAAIAIVLRALGREQPSELTAAVLLVLLATTYAVWAGTRKAPTLPVLVGVGAIVQLIAVLWYHHSGFAADAAVYSRVAADILDPSTTVAERYSLQRSEWSNWAITQITAGIYRITGVSRLSAFLVFGTVAVIAKAIFANSLLRLRGTLGRSADVIAVGVMIYPSLALWLGAISKEVPAVLGIALVLSGILRPLGRSTGFVSVAAGLLITATTRPHVAAVVAGAVVVYAATSAALVSQSFGRRVAILTGAVVFGLGSVFGTAAFFGIDPSPSGFQEVRDDVAPGTDQGDSDIEPRPVRTPVDVPIASANVLLRPLPHETTNVASLLQSLETMALLGFAVLLLSQRRLRSKNRLYGAARRYVQALRVLAVSYLLLFVYAFSGMYNLGLMSRQRTQATLFVFLLLATGLVSTRRRSRATAATQSSPLVFRPPDADAHKQRPEPSETPPVNGLGGPLVHRAPESTP